MAERVVGSAGASLAGFLACACLVCGLLDAVRAPSASRLNQRAGIVFAKQVRIVMSQGPHQLHMEVVHHVGTRGEIRLSKGYARPIDTRAQCSVEIPLGAAG